MLQTVGQHPFTSMPLASPATRVVQVNHGMSPITPSPLQAQPPQQQKSQQQQQQQQNNQQLQLPKEQFCLQ